MKTKELQQLIKIREGVTSDAYVCAEVCGEYKHLPVKDLVVMDIGGNIGAFAKYASAMGAAKVITYEPSAENFTQFLLNCADDENIIPIFAALTMHEGWQNNFYLTNGKAKDGFSTVEFNGRTKVVVPSLSFYDQLEKYRPTSIKMDIEGGEFELLSQPLPKFVKSIVVEIHFSKKRFREQFENIVKMFPEDQWEAIIKPKQTGTNFHTLAQYSRI